MPTPSRPASACSAWKASCRPSNRHMQLRRSSAAPRPPKTKSSSSTTPAAVIRTSKSWSASSSYNRPMTARYVYWQADDTWLGYLEEFPDYWTQGASLDDLQE